MQKLIDTFVNAIYVYDDKLLITFNYRDSEKCVELAKIQEIIYKNNDPPAIAGGISFSGITLITTGGAQVRIL